jgi:hypothetical protein
MVLLLLLRTLQGQPVLLEQLDQQDRQGQQELTETTETMELQDQQGLLETE